MVSRMITSGRSARQPGRCRRPGLASGHEQRQDPCRPPELPLLRVRLGDRQVGRPLRGVPGLGQRRGGGRRPGPHRRRPGEHPGRADRPGLGGGLPGPHQRRARARPGARRRHRARRGRAARRRAGRRQVHAAARGRRGRPPARGCAPSTSPARSPPPRSGCAPTAPAASTTSSTSPPRPTWARCSATSRRSGPSCWSSTPCRPSAPPTSTASPAASPRSRRSRPRWSGWPRPRTSPPCMVGHVTKDGSIAGPRVLEHLVDVVLHFEGERSSRLRMVRAVKNRFGPVDEVGCFDLSGEGIVAVTDPTGLFVARHHEPVAGTCVSVVLEGRRPILAEVQALVTPATAERPRRTTSGLDGSRDRDDRGRAPAAGPDPAAHPRRVRLDRRRASGSSSRPPTWPRPSRWRRRGSSATSPPTWWRSARSAWPASCAGSATSRSGSPRPPGSASAARSCRPSRTATPAWSARSTA